MGDKVYIMMVRFRPTRKGDEPGPWEIPGLWRPTRAPEGLRYLQYCAKRHNDGEFRKRGGQEHRVFAAPMDAFVEVPA